MSNYDATGGEQGWTMKSKLNELRLDAGIARIENQQWLCVLDKETGTMIDPMIGLEKFAQLIVQECARVAVYKDDGMISTADVAGYITAGRLAAARMIKQHFGVEE